MVTVNYGVFLNNTIDFIITAFAIFLLVKAVNAVRKLEAAKPPPPPPPSDEVKLLTEIRDLLRTR
jgi:large conductance mechanosensitive channel